MVRRELNLAAARPATYRTRFWSALLTVLITLPMLIGSRRSTSSLGKDIFEILSILAFAYVLLSGVRCTADALSQEKREGTLGLLFLTDLKGYDVVLGKLGVTSIDAAYGLIAMLPLLGLPLFLGSVTGTEFWQMNLLLLNTLFLSLAVGLLISTFGQSERAVMLNTLIALCAVTFGLPFLWFPLSHLIHKPQVDLLLLSPSPAYTMKVVLSGGAPSEFWTSMFVIASLGFLALVTSVVMLPRVFQEKSRNPWAHRWLETWHRWRFCDPKFRNFQGGRWVELQPFLWLLSRDRLSRMAIYVFTGILFAFALATPGFLRPRGSGESIIVYGTFALHVLFKLLVAADSCRRLNEDKRSGALELLLATPLPVRDILGSQSLSTRTFFILPTVILGFMNLFLLMEVPSLGRELGMSLFGGIVLLGADGYALTWIGMLNALREPRYVRAVLRTTGTVLLLPWAVFMFFMFCFRPSLGEVHLFIFCWSLASIVFDLVLATRAKHKLLGRFRFFAANDGPPLPLIAFSRSDRNPPTLLVR